MYCAIKKVQNCLFTTHHFKNCCVNRFINTFYIPSEIFIILLNYILFVFMQSLVTQIQTNCVTDDGMKPKHL